MSRERIRTLHKNRDHRTGHPLKWTDVIPWRVMRTVDTADRRVAVIEPHLMWEMLQAPYGPHGPMSHREEQLRHALADRTILIRSLLLLPEIAGAPVLEREPHKLFALLAQRGYAIPRRFDAMHPYWQRGEVKHECIRWDGSRLFASPTRYHNVRVVAADARFVGTEAGPDFDLVGFVTEHAAACAWSPGSDVIWLFAHGGLAIPPKESVPVEFESHKPMLFLPTAGRGADAS